jgi:hypothetical protein
MKGEAVDVQPGKPERKKKMDRLRMFQRSAEFVF